MNDLYAPGTCEWLADELDRSRLIERDRLTPLVAEFRLAHPEGDARRLAGFLALRRVLSRFQAEKALAGESSALVLGPYGLIEPIGSGALGPMFRAVARGGGATVAVKVLPGHRRWDLRQTGRQVREFAAMPAHPAVVPCIDVGVAQGRHYLAWPISEGETLAASVKRRGPLTMGESARLALRLAEGLHDCHERGLFHGLLQPSNVQLGPDGSPRLLDFGVGAILAENTDESLLNTLASAGHTPGTFDCASPESILDPASRSPASDQYGLGCVLFFALTGAYPFDDGSLVDRMLAHQMKPPPLDRLGPSVPIALTELIGRLLAKLPAVRYPNRRELLQALERIAGGTRVALPAFSPEDTLPRSTTEDTPSEMPLPGSKLALRPSAQGTTPPPPATTLLERVVDRLSFWRPERDALALSILAPTPLACGANVPLVVFTHRVDEPDAFALGRTYFPHHHPIATIPLRRPVRRGTRLTLHLALPGIVVEPSVQKLVWRGPTMPLPFHAHIPPDYRPGDIVGVVSIAEGAEVMMDVEFGVEVG